MNLKEIRIKFRDLSGRYDLVNDDFSDNGANFFINEASRWLDKTVETTKSWGSYMIERPAGVWYVKFPLARAVKEVWISTIEGRWQLEKIRLQDLIASYFSGTPADLVNGSPEYYSPLVTRHIPENITPVQLAAFATYVGVIPSMAHDYNAIIMSAPVDQATLVEIVGLFYSMELTADTDENYWSKVNPLMLVEAAIRQTYILGGNKPMLDVLDRGIDGDLTRLDKDLVEQISAEIDEMEG